MLSELKYGSGDLVELVITTVINCYQELITLVITTTSSTIGLTTVHVMDVHSKN